MRESGYYAVIKFKMFEDDRLNANMIILYALITALANKNGYCYASNQYFSNILRVSTESISRWLTKLEKYGYISRELKPKKGAITERKIYLLDGSDKQDTKITIPEDKPKPKKEIDLGYYEMANYMYNKILQMNENYKKPNMEKWADEFRKMIEIDNIKVEELGELIDKIYRDDFWSKNILSPSKLRSKYDDLTIRLKNKKITALDYKLNKTWEEIWNE